MTALLALIASNPTIIALFAAVVGGIGWGFQQRLAGAKAERNKQIAAQAAERMKNHDLIVKKVEDARLAGERVGTASANRVPDRYDRDNTR